jgi:predicted esterase YcpF (UPF0227 family)
MILYIHGFGGSGKGFKAAQFRKYYEDKGIAYLAPSLSYVPTLALSTLEDIIKNCKDKDIKLIGSSLGGFYAIYLANKFNLKAVLINPSTKPNATLERILSDGKALNYFDLSYFDFNKNHLYMLKNYMVPKPKQELFMLMLQKDDDVIDYLVAKEEFKDSKQIITTGGGHGFEGIEEYFDKIDDFFWGLKAKSSQLL